jgi:single-stranded DNA-binding protein
MCDKTFDHSAKITIVAQIMKSVDITSFGDNKKVGKIIVFTSKSKEGKDGVNYDKKQYYKIVVWSRTLIDNVVCKLVVGDTICAKGTHVYAPSTDKDGKKTFFNEIHVSTLTSGDFVSVLDIKENEFACHNAQYANKNTTACKENSVLSYDDVPF